MDSDAAALQAQAEALAAMEREQAGAATSSLQHDAPAAPPAKHGTPAGSTGSGAPQFGIDPQVLQAAMAIVAAQRVPPKSSALPAPTTTSAMAPVSVPLGPPDVFEPPALPTGGAPDLKSGASRPRPPLATTKPDEMDLAFFEHCKKFQVPQVTVDYFSSEFINSLEDLAQYCPSSEDVWNRLVQPVAETRGEWRYRVPMGKLWSFAHATQQLDRFILRSIQTPLCPLRND